MEPEIKNPPLSEEEQSFLEVATALRDGKPLSSMLTEKLIQQLLVPLVRQNKQWVARYLAEELSSSDTDLAKSLAASLWDKINDPQNWKKLWNHDSVMGENLKSAQIHELRKICKGIMLFWFRDQARYPSLARPLSTLVRKGHLTTDNSSELKTSVVYLPHMSQASLLQDSVQLDVRSFSFPPRKQRTQKNMGNDWTSGITPMLLLPLIQAVFKRYPYKIPFSKLLEFLTKGYNIEMCSLDAPLSEESDNSHEKIADITHRLPAEKIENEESIQSAIAAVRALVLSSENEPLNSKAHTFLQFFLWHGFKTKSGESYVLAAYEKEYGVPSSTASEHMRFWQSELKKIVDTYGLKHADGMFWLEQMRKEFIHFKPEFLADSSC